MACAAGWEAQALSMNYVCCPKCHSPYGLIRIGVVGKRGVKDSRTLKCEYCNYVFRTRGQTWKEWCGVKIPV